MNEELLERIVEAVKSGMLLGSVDGALTGLGQTLLCEAEAEEDLGKLIAGKMLLSIAEKPRQA